MNDKNFEIRQAELSDAEQLAKICREELGYKCETELLTRQLKALDPKRECVFVARADNKAVGFVHIEMYNVIYAENASNILGLAVASDFSGQGIGKALMQEAEKWANERNASFVRLNSGFSREAAHEFYRHIGYDNEKNQIRFMKFLK